MVVGRILTMSDVRAIRTAEELRAWLGTMNSIRPRLMQLGLREIPVVVVDEDAPPAFARVNHGEWIADCPERGCGGALLLVRDAPFFCPACLNAGVGHRWRVVEWPDATAIEAVLLRQPMVHLRNWEPGIDVTTLVATVEGELRGERPKPIRVVQREARERAQRGGR